MTVPRSKAVIISIEFREGKIAMLHACNHVGGWLRSLRGGSSP
jgi:hypothetical protein